MRRALMIGVMATVVGGGMAWAAAPDSIDGPATVPPAAVASPAGAPCPSWPEQAPAGRTADPLVEVSGTAGSRLLADHWWVHNDSGDSARAFLVDRDLRVVATVSLTGVFAFDFEDIAIGPDGTVWVSDSGDNLSIRDSAMLYGFAESRTDASTRPRMLEVRYPDRRHDVETFMIDARSGDGFFVDKRINRGMVTVLKIPAAALANGGQVTAEVVGSLDVSTGGSIGPTGGDISPDGSMIVVKTLSTTYLWPRPRGATVAETFAASPSAPCRVDGGAGSEAIGFDRDGRVLASLSEGLGSGLHLFDERF